MNELHQRMCKTTDGTASEHQDFTVSSEWSWHFYVTESKNSLFKEKTLSRPTSSRGLYSKVPRIHQRWSIQSWLSLQLRWVGAVLQLLPKKFLAAYFEKSADGCRTQKERVTISVCSNATGKINLPHLLKWKAKNPRCLSMPAELIYPLPICQPSKCMGQCATVHLLVSWPLCSLVSKLREMNLEPKAQDSSQQSSSTHCLYVNQANAWVNVQLFTCWFHDHFVPWSVSCGKWILSLRQCSYCTTALLIRMRKSWFQQMG